MEDDAQKKQAVKMEDRVYFTLWVLLASFFILFVLSLIAAIQPDWAYLFINAVIG